MSTPIKMETPSEGSLTNINQVEVFWLELITLEETGGTYSIDSYNLEISWLPDTWLEVVGDTQTGDFTGLTYLEENL